MIRNLKRVFRTFSDVTKFTEKYVLTDQQLNDILRKPKSDSKKNAIKTSESDKIQKVQQQEKKPMIYDLLTKNEPFPVVYDEQQTRVTAQTINQNIFQRLKLNALSSYQDYEIALKKEFNNELDMYGDQYQVKQITNLEFKHLLTYDSKYLQKVRKAFMMNISIPGTIQNQDPHNFLTLRPVEQFRNTPLIPISDSAMKKHKQMLEEYHRRAFVFEIKQQSIVNFILFSITSLVCGYLIMQALKKEEETSVSYQRLKLKRIMGQDDKTLL